VSDRPVVVVVGGASAWGKGVAGACEVGSAPGHGKGRVEGGLMGRWLPWWREELIYTVSERDGDQTGPGVEAVT